MCSWPTRNNGSRDQGEVEKEERAQVHHRNLLHQVSEREKDVHTLREQYRDLQKVYDEKLESLEHKLQQSKEKFKSLEERRKVEIASFQKDISFFKNNIRQLERELMIKKKEAVSGSRPRTSSTLSRGRSSSSVAMGDGGSDDETSEKQVRLLHCARSSESAPQLTLRTAAQRHHHSAHHVVWLQPGGAARERILLRGAEWPAAHGRA